MMRHLALLAVLALLVAGCEVDQPQATTEASAQPRASGQVDHERVDAVLTANIDRIVAYADSIEAALRPEPLLRPNEVAAFNRFRNPDHLARARQLGVPQPVSESALQQHLESGRLVELRDNEYWIIRELDYSSPYVTPDAEALLREIGQRFQAALDERGLPALRMEITSVLRSADDQARLRRVNPNAARGESTHQYGTTIDIAYSSFVGPQTHVVDLDLGEDGWLEPHLRRMEDLGAETGAARMSRELQAILGHVMRAMQNEGKVMVTMEILQPVYHITVAQRY